MLQKILNLLLSSHQEQHITTDFCASVIPSYTYSFLLIIQQILPATLPVSLSTLHQEYQRKYHISNLENKEIQLRKLKLTQTSMLWSLLCSCISEQICFTYEMEFSIGKSGKFVRGKIQLNSIQIFIPTECNWGINYFKVHSLNENLVSVPNQYRIQSIQNLWTGNKVQRVYL